MPRSGIWAGRLQSRARTVEEIDSGAKTRPRREELLRAARRREIDVIVVWRLDRWGRSLVDLIATLQVLTALKVGAEKSGLSR
jgi:DNA invertase Pin-like site-specific DNA recombinase